MFFHVDILFDGLEEINLLVPSHDAFLEVFGHIGIRFDLEDVDIQSLLVVFGEILVLGNEEGVLVSNLVDQHFV